MKILFFNKALRILLTTNAFILIAAAMFGPISALFVKKIGGDLLDASYAGAIFAFTAGVATIISGKYCDNIKENELVIVMGYAVMGLGFFLYTFVNSVFLLLIVQVIIGIGEAIYAPAFGAVYSKHLDGHKSGQQWSIWEASNYFTAAIGALIGGFIVTLFGFDAIFIIMSLLCFASALYIYQLPREIL